jgi:hypothetical protein
MTYISKTSREFEASGLMLEGFGLLKALKPIAAILREALALARTPMSGGASGVPCWSSTTAYSMTSA